MYFYLLPDLCFKWTYSASTRHSPAFVLYGHKPVLLFKDAISFLILLLLVKSIVLKPCLRL